MLGRRQTIFLTPYFQCGKKFVFIFVYVMNMRDDFLCLPSWHHGKQNKLSCKSHGILLSDFCGNSIMVGSDIPITTYIHFDLNIPMSPPVT